MQNHGLLRLATASDYFGQIHYVQQLNTGYIYIFYRKEKHKQFSGKSIQHKLMIQ